MGELENSKDPQQAEGSNHQKGLGARDDQAEIRGKDGEQIDDAEEAASVGCRIANAVEAQQVLDGKNNCHHPLESAQHGAVLSGDRGGTFEHHSDDTEDDQNQQRDIEGFAGRGVGLEDDFMHLRPKTAAVVRHRDHFSR